MPQQHPALIGVQTLPADLLTDVVEIFKALGDPTRAQLVYLLTNREYSVNELSQYVDVTSSAVSHHLRQVARHASGAHPARRQPDYLFD